MLGDIAKKHTKKKTDISTIERESLQFTDLSRLILIPTYNGNISIVQWQWVETDVSSKSSVDTCMEPVPYSLRPESVHITFDAGLHNPFHWWFHLYECSFRP